MSPRWPAILVPHPDLDEKVYEGIEGELDRIIAGQSLFGPRKNAKISVAEMFKPFPREPSRENLIDGVAGRFDTKYQSNSTIGARVTLVR